MKTRREPVTISFNVEDTSTSLGPASAATRAAMLTDFVGADLTMLALADETEFVPWASLLQGWARTLNAQGVAALFAAIQASSVPGRPGFAERVLAASRIKAEHPMAFADAFAVATALAFDATLLTGAPEIIDAPLDLEILDLR